MQPPKAWDTPLGRRLWPLPDEGLPVDAFMQACLYDPELGYYARPLQEPADGDFVTAAATPTLAEAVARAAQRLAAQLPRFELMEIGPGTGALLAGVLDRLRTAGVEPDRVVAVDVHAATKGLPPRLQPWSETVELVQPEKAPAVTGLVVANEVLDALPVALLERADDGWAEVRLHSAPGKLVERLHPVRPGLALVAAAHGPAASPGHRFEHPPALEDTIAAWSSWLRKGCLLTLDYGGFPKEIYTMPNGTLRAYHRHVALHPFALPGVADMTADVNFAAVLRTAAEAGFALGSYGTQAAWLLHMVGPTPDRLAWHPAAMGERFRAAILDRGGFAQRAGLAPP